VRGTFERVIRAVSTPPTPDIHILKQAKAEYASCNRRENSYSRFLPLGSRFPRPLTLRVDFACSSPLPFHPERHKRFYRLLSCFERSLCTFNSAPCS